MTRRISEAMSKLGRGASIANIQDFFPQVLRGGDPLGEFFVESVSPGDRRAHGATFTPSWLIDLQLDQIAGKCAPVRVVDAGAGTGRYALRAARRWPRATVIAVERDPALAEAIRINAQATGVKIQILCGDYLSITLPPLDGVTAFVGNPPYVRHHDISPQDKAWYSSEMAGLRLPHSQLAGLHVYFYLKSYLLSKPGDVGCRRLIRAQPELVAALPMPAAGHHPLTAQAWIDHALSASAAARAWQASRLPAPEQAAARLLPASLRADHLAALDPALVKRYQLSAVTPVGLQKRADIWERVSGQ